MMTTMLKQARSRIVPGAHLASSTRRSYTFNSLTWGVRSMSYQMARIDAEFQHALSERPAADRHAGRAAQAQYQAWNQEVVGASQVAARQQTTLSNARQPGDADADVLSAVASRERRRSRSCSSSRR